MRCLHSKVFSITVSNCFFLGLFLVSWHLVSAPLHIAALACQMRITFAGNKGPRPSHERIVSAGRPGSAKGNLRHIRESL